MEENILTQVRVGSKKTEGLRKQEVKTLVCQVSRDNCCSSLQIVHLLITLNLLFLALQGVKKEFYGNMYNVHLIKNENNF